jgi:hypothetical protein
MRYFQLLDFQNTVLLIFLGLTFLILAYLAFGYPDRKGEQEALEEFPDGIKEGNGPLPPLLIFLYLGFAVWAIAYVLVIGIQGQPF